MASAARRRRLFANGRRSRDVGANQGAPLIHNGTMCLPNPWGRVQAIHPVTGDLIRDCAAVGPMTRETLHTLHLGQLRSVFLCAANVYVVEPVQAGIDSATGPGGSMVWVFALPVAQ